MKNKRFMKSTLLLGASLLAILNCGPEKETIQTGPRYSLSGDYVPVGTVQASIAPLALSPMSTRDWSQHLSQNSHEIPNAPMSASPRLVAAVDLGIKARKPVYGASAPIIVGGVVYHYDAAGYLNAVTLSGGKLWRVPLIPAGESAGDGFGGGVAYENGVIYAATGYGEVIAVSAQNGGIIWRYKQAAPLRKAPLISNGRAIIISEGTQAVGLNAANGAQVWRQYSAQTTVPARMNAGVPASQSGQAVLSYATGEIQFVNAQSGSVQWNITSLGDRFSGSKSPIGDISGDPVITGGNFIAGTASGLASVSLGSGQVNWVNSIGTKGPLVVSGNSIFGISEGNQLYRISVNNGQTNWVKPLPTKESRRFFGSSMLHFDARLVNSQVWVFDNQGNLRRFDATTGGLLGVQELPKLAQAPVFGNGAMVAMGENGKLLIFR